VGPWHCHQVALRHLHRTAMEAGASSSGQLGLRMAEAAHDVFISAGSLGRPSIVRHPENLGGVSCRRVFLRAESPVSDPTRINVQMFVFSFSPYFTSFMFHPPFITLC
jgi:hypothetical protein